MVVIVPVVASPPGAPSTLHVAPRFAAVPSTIAVNCCLCVLATTAAIPGEIFTVSVATVRSSVAICVKPPDVPVKVTVAEPVRAELLAVKVKVLVDVAGLGLKDAVTPFGSPDALNATALLKPFSGMTVTVLELSPACATVSALGAADKVKFGDASTVRLTNVL